MRRLRICFADRELRLTPRMRKLISLFIDQRDHIRTLKTGKVIVHLSDSDVRLTYEYGVMRSEEEIVRAMAQSVGLED